MRVRIVRCLAIATMILGCGGAQIAAASPASGDMVATGTLSAVVPSPDSDTVRLKVIIGRGFSLRVFECFATSATAIVDGKSGITRPGDLRPGSILRVRYVQEKDRNVALVIEVIPPEIVPPKGES